MKKFFASTFGRSFLRFGRVALFGAISYTFDYITNVTLPGLNQTQSIVLITSILTAINKYFREKGVKYLGF